MMRPRDYLHDAADFYAVAGDSRLSTDLQALAAAKGQLAASIGLLMMKVPAIHWPEMDGDE